MGTHFILFIALAIFAGPSDQLELKPLANLPVNAGPYNFATIAQKILDPNDEGPTPHKHAGHTVAVVVEGEYLLQVDDQPPVILSAGQSFHMSAPAAMVWGANASKKNKCQVVFVLFKKDDTPIMSFFEKKRDAYQTVVTKGKRQPNNKIE